MSADHQKEQLLAALNKDPGAAIDLFFAVNEVVADFHDWGPVLQADENGDYTPETAIMQLQQTRDAIKRLAGWSVD